METQAEYKTIQSVRVMAGRRDDVPKWNSESEKPTASGYYPIIRTTNHSCESWWKCYFNKNNGKWYFDETCQERIYWVSFWFDLPPLFEDES